MSEYLTLKEAAKVSGYHQDYLSQLIRSGKLSARRLGKEWVTSRVAIATYLSSRGKVPLDKSLLRLPWYQNTKKFWLAMTVIAALIFLIIGGSLENAPAQISENDFGSQVLIDEQTVFIGGDEIRESQAIVITGYSLDEVGETQLSITTRQ